MLHGVAGKFKSKITVSKDGIEANAKSVMDLCMLLPVVCGTTLTIRAAGEDARDAVKAVVNLIKNDFNMNE
jgi:phosphocarrier protein